MLLTRAVLLVVVYFGVIIDCVYVYFVVVITVGVAAACADVLCYCYCGSFQLSLRCWC